MLVLLAAFSLAQLRLFIHLYTQDWLIAHMLSPNKPRHGWWLSRSRIEESPLPDGTQAGALFAMGASLSRGAKGSQIKAHACIQTILVLRIDPDLLRDSSIDSAE